MKNIEVNNETSRDLYVKILVDIKTVEIRGRTAKFISVDETKDIDSIVVIIKE